MKDTVLSMLATAAALLAFWMLAGWIVVHGVHRLLF